jgi:hypothetical protein
MMLPRQETRGDRVYAATFTVFVAIEEWVVTLLFGAVTRRPCEFVAFPHHCLMVLSVFLMLFASVGRQDACGDCKRKLRLRSQSELAKNSRSASTECLVRHLRAVRPVRLLWHRVAFDSRERSAIHAACAAQNAICVVCVFDDFNECAALPPA